MQDHIQPISLNEVDEIVYEGEVNERGERHGNGIGVFADGTLYLGAWKSNLRVARHAIQYNVNG